MEKLIESYKNHLTQERGFLPRSVRIYTDNVLTFLRHEKIEKADQINKLSLDAYREHLLTEDITNDTRNLILISLRSFVKYLNEKGETQHIFSLIKLFPAKKYSQKKIELVSDEQLKLFLTYSFNKRDDTIINFIYETGLRLAETCALNVGDVIAMSEKGVLSTLKKVTVVGKGDKPRLAFFTNHVSKLLLGYMKERTKKYKENYLPISPDFLQEPLFTNADGGRLTDDYIQKNFRWRSEKLSIKPSVHPHMLRHFYATRLLQNGADLRSLMSLLGHSHISTTERYLHISNNHLEETYRKFHT